MGMRGPISKSSLSSYDFNEPKQKRTIVEGNPDPANFRLEKHSQMGNYLIVKVRYPDAKNYEGQKVLVFRNLTYDKLKTFKTIDPHFSNNPNYASPFARFEPTMIGWAAARILCEALKNEE